MPLARGIWQIAVKEFRHMLQDRITLLLTFALPVFQLLLYGMILDTRIHNVPAAVVNHDTHQASRVLVDRLAHSPLFQLRPEYQDFARSEAAMRAGVLKVLIEIPPDYSSSLMYAGKGRLVMTVDGADVATSNYVLAALESLGDVHDVRTLRQSVSVEARVLFNTEAKMSVFFLPGLLAVLIQTITTLLLIFSISSERERGTLEQLLATRITPDAILLGKCLAIGAVGLLESAVLAALMQTVFHIQIAGSLALFVAVMPLFVVTPLGIGLLIVALAHSQTHALQLAQVVFLPSIMLSGFVFPREFLNPKIGWLSDALPTAYLVSLSRNVILRGASVAEAAPDIIVSGSFALALFVAGWIVARSRMRL